ncbi:hypothetical protein ACFVP3_37110 [Streptomyces sp. NPDC057806]|uniref:hypothetical protein n=1 Tax=unclassified Streptomyces TaxID=2593676 RepID=UPI003689546D
MASSGARRAICGDPESIHDIVTTGRSEADNDAPNPSMKSFHSKISGARLYANAWSAPCRS